MPNVLESTEVKEAKTEEQLYYSALAEKIASARKAAGLTQKQIADALALNRVTITRIEANIDRPSAWTVLRLERILGVPLYSVEVS